VLVITSNQRRTGFIWVLLLAVLLLVPLVWLSHLLEELRGKDEIYLDMQARERLLNEMASFQERLKAERYIEAALEDMRDKFAINIDNDNRRNLSFSYATDPMLIQSDFPASASTFLKQNYHITPLLAFAVDCDMQNFYAHYSRNLFADDKVRQSFERAAAFWMVFSQHNVVNELPTTPDLKTIGDSYKNADPSGYENTQRKFNDIFQEHISPFGTPPIANGICRPFFSNRFGSQRSFQLIHQIVRPRGLSVSMLGCYYFIFNSSDISPAKLLKTALNSTDPALGRFVVNKAIERPQFIYEADHLLYYSAFPSNFSTLIEDFAISNPRTRNQLRDFISRHGLCVRIERKQLVSGYKMATEICGALARALLLLFLAVLVRSYMQDIEHGLRLARKLRIAVAIIVMLPVIGVFLLNRQYEASTEKMNMIKCQTKIRRQIDFLGKLIGDTDARILLMQQETKKYLAYRYYQLSDTNLSTIINEGHFRKLTTGVLEGSLTRDGKAIMPSNRRGSEGTSIRTGLYKILLDLGKVDTQAAEIEKIHRQYMVLIGLAGALTNLFSEPEALAREGLLNRHILSASALLRSVHHFIAHPKRPGVIDAIALIMVDDINIIKNLYAQLSQGSLHLFSEYDENSQIDYALAMRSPTSLRAYQAPNFSAPSNQMTKLAAAAMNSKTSGSITRRSGDQILIDSWAISDLNPVIILARATLSRNLLLSPTSAILAWALLIYSILAVTLISDILADIFLAPVKAMLAFVSRLRQNDLQVKVVISSGGEFEELGNSFNQMSEGLRQREKMRRFVSDKLVTSLESHGESQKPVRATLSVLSSDIRGFTALSEQYPPEEIVSLLNDYFSCMEEALQLHGGSIEKIVGDAITAAFYDDAGQECHAARACRAAKEMKTRLQSFNHQREESNRFTIRTGIGIASGEAVLGFAAGGSGRREFVLIGEVTHRAEALEAQTRWSSNSGIFIDRATADLSAEPVEEVSLNNGEGAICLELKHD
jgi:class 3 adenylate cyclase